MDYKELVKDSGKSQSVIVEEMSKQVKISGGTLARVIRGLREFTPKEKRVFLEVVGYEEQGETKSSESLIESQQRTIENLSSALKSALKVLALIEGNEEKQAIRVLVEELGKDYGFDLGHSASDGGDRLEDVVIKQQEVIEAYLSALQ